MQLEKLLLFPDKPRPAKAMNKEEEKSVKLDNIEEEKLEQQLIYEGKHGKDHNETTFDDGATEDKTRFQSHLITTMNKNEE